ncbi:hypothetical protein NDU88_003553 [Pleurodeles waltl]|uniref:Uncharacterized protein n=1 Tax=Pleurodeles waltl TaxID=8319 RepID=A0AAV7MTS1_PLEWA|nr:hypothetical protein NDU88_003553 [Pleurodeles waltl]
MTYDAEGVIKRKREDGRKERSEEKEEPRTRKSRGEETTTIQEPEEERENTGAGEQSTKREPTFTQELKGEEDTASNELKGEEDTASNVIETEGETWKAGRLEDRRNQWATPNPTEEKSGDHLLAGRAPGGTWPSQGRPEDGKPDRLKTEPRHHQSLEREKKRGFEEIETRADLVKRNKRGLAKI